jgi:NADH/NAD ratio-sensing transcriptional regulator Rex
LLERWNFGNLLTSNKINGVHVDVATLTADAQSAQDVVDVLSQRFIGTTLPDDARSILLDFASSGDLGSNLASIAGLILGSPHFQVR